MIMIASRVLLFKASFFMTVYHTTWLIIIKKLFNCFVCFSCCAFWI